MKIDVNGTEVVVRTKVPARDGYQLMPIMEKFGEDFSFAKLPYDDMVTIINVLVESWGFDGDPSTPDGVAELELKDMIGVGTQAVATYWNPDGESAPSPN